jgi:phenylpropionate dioxygenase-like ring-hydroxylating dioxygenase large terminal subunit
VSARCAFGHHTVVSLGAHWFIACRSRALRDRPVAAMLHGVPLVLFRGADGRPGALEDRCPHRNAPLSAGRIRGDALECRYHGWRFDAGGACVAVPGLASPPDAPASRATPFACVEQDGYVWVHSSAGAAPRAPPPRFPHLDDPRYTTVRRELEVRSTLYRALENVLDVPHTAFLHRGLFRTSGAARDIEVVVRRWADRCEAEFIGEPVPTGLAARLLAPGGGVVRHVDRFLLPSIAQVEYRLGDASHVVVTTAMTPLAAARTKLYSAATFRLPVPGWLVRPVLTPVAARILGQDAWMLALQTDNVERFGGERFAHTELDVLGPQIQRMLRRAERGEAAPGEDGPEHEHRVRMRL